MFHSTLTLITVVYTQQSKVISVWFGFSEYFNSISARLALKIRSNILCHRIWSKLKPKLLAYVFLGLAYATFWFWFYDTQIEKRFMLLRMSFLLFAGLCRRLKFSTKIDGYALQFHVIKTCNLSIYVGPSVRSTCIHRCIMDPVCVSVNIGPPTDEKFICELCESDHTKHPEDLKQREGFLYIGTEVVKLLWVEDIFSVLLIFWP